MRYGRFSDFVSMEETPFKQERYGISVATHTQAVHHVGTFDSYSLIDITGGPGYYDGKRNHQGYIGKGSPLIATKYLDRLDMPTDLIVVEREKDIFERLVANVNAIYEEEVSLIFGDHNSSLVLMRILLRVHRLGEKPGGLIYYDPEGVGFPVRALPYLLDHLPGHDLQMHLPISLYKRLGRAHPTLEHFNADVLHERLRNLDRQYLVLHYCPHPWQWTTLFMSNSQEVAWSMHMTFRSEDFRRGESHFDGDAWARLNELCTVNSITKPRKTRT